MTNHKFSLVEKDRLFYDRFKYCLGFWLDEVSCLRQLDHDSIDNNMDRRKQWRELSLQRWAVGQQNYIENLQRNWKEITEKTVADLHVLAEHLLTTKSTYKLVVSANQGHIYTNDLTLIDHLSELSELNHKTYTQAQVSRPRNTVVLKNSQHKFRSYLKFFKLTQTQKDQLANFLHSQQDQVRLSPALSCWLDIPFNRSQDYFFIDHATESWLTMLNLVHSGLVRKTMHIIVTK